MLLSKNVQYGIVGALAVYVVFFTRPAPLFLVNLLSNPLAQLAVLGAVVYVGAKVSLLVALVAAVAVVLTIPSREFAGKNGDKMMKKLKDKKKTVEKPKKMGVESEPSVLPSELSALAGGAAASSDPAPEGDKMVAKTDSHGSDKTSGGGAPF